MREIREEYLLLEEVWNGEREWKLFIEVANTGVPCV
jgi:hypothetical protein